MHIFHRTKEVTTSICCFMTGKYSGPNLAFRQFFTLSFDLAFQDWANPLLNLSKIDLRLSCVNARGIVWSTGTWPRVESTTTSAPSDHAPVVLSSSIRIKEN